MNNSLHHKSLSRLLLPHSARLLMVLVPCIASPLAFAENPQYRHNQPPVCEKVITGLSAEATCQPVTVTGLGNKDIRVTISLVASAPTTCHNPKGHTSPGQNPAISTGSTSIDIENKDKNGSLLIPELSATVTLVAPTPKAAGCPNGKWTVTVGSPVTFVAMYRVEQPVGTFLQNLTVLF